jgi:hypothetical protein
MNGYSESCLDGNNCQVLVDHRKWRIEDADEMSACHCFRRGTGEI